MPSRRYPSPFDDDPFFAEGRREIKGMQRKFAGLAIVALLVNLAFYAAVIAGLAFAVVWVVNNI